MGTSSEEVADSTPQSLVPCPVCGRKFLSDRLERHIVICQKTKQKKRKAFDSSKQRSLADEASMVSVPPPIQQHKSIKNSKASQKSKQTNGSSTQNENSKSNWRQQHQEFVQAIRAARGVKDESNSDDAVAAEPQKKVPAGYVECPTCGRNFNRNAAERHMPFCKEQKARIPRSPTSHDAMARFKARTKYKKGKGERKGSSDSLKSTSTVNGVTANAVSPPASTPQQPKSRSTSPAKRPPKAPNYKNTVTSRVKSQLDSQRVSQQPKTPVMKFKEKFPNHGKAGGGYSTTKYIQDSENLQELLRRPDTLTGHIGPRTVPGVRTGGMSPTKIETRPLDDEDDFVKLKARIEDMYLNGINRQKASPNGLNTNGTKFPGHITDVDTRGSTSGSSDGSSIPTVSRGNSSEGRTSGSGGLPRFCHQCGTKYPVALAKYCYECGARRLGTVGPFLSN